jgi:hypothetical protein
MKTSDMRESKFLKQIDVGRGVLFTVEGIEQHNVAKDGVEPEMKYCMAFCESEKPLVLNATNIQLCEKIFGSDDTDNWTGKRLVLYTDPTISFGGKVVGGIRVRAPKVKPKTGPALVQPVQSVRAVAVPAAEVAVEIEPDFDGRDLDDSDIPF